MSNEYSSSAVLAATAEVLREERERIGAQLAELRDETMRLSARLIAVDGSTATLGGRIDATTAELASDLRQTREWLSAELTTLNRVTEGYAADLVRGLEDQAQARERGLTQAQERIAAQSQQLAQIESRVAERMASLEQETAARVAVLDATAQRVEREQDALAQGLRAELRAIEVTPGEPGVGFNTAIWEPGIYREGTIVQYALGKCARAVRDTNAAPSDREQWERIGTVGFEFKGVRKDSESYEQGDYYVDGGSLFLWWKGRGRLVAQRGVPGQPGKPGADGRPGRDAPTIAALAFTRDGLTAEFDDGTQIAADVRGITQWMGLETRAAIDDWWAEQQAAIDGTPIISYRGQWSAANSYARGQVVLQGGATWLCYRAVRADSGFTPDSWTRLGASGGGYYGGGATGGGGGGGGPATSIGGKPLPGVSPSDGEVLIYRTSAGAWLYEPLPAPGLPLSGGTLTGPLLLPAAAPSQATQAVTKAYADSKWGLWRGTQAAYDALSTKDATTLYAITP